MDVDMSIVDWSRAQFALTAIYHWFFVPLTLGLSFIVAIMETMYVKSGEEEWKRITRFWMTLFGVNFAIGVATGIILEFEFGTNWANYSWIVGDIFGAPLAIEGILAFFLESTFISVMFFGWAKVSKRFHLVSTWLVAIGSSLSALWILVANGWMQSPVGMEFNPDTARNEMANFWQVLLNPVAVSKFTHTVTSCFVVASLFVVGISAWYLLKKREALLASRSIAVASIFGLSAALLTAVTGDSTSKVVAVAQPMKLAAMEGLYEGARGVELIAVGVLNPDKQVDSSGDPCLFKIAIPNMLSVLAFNDAHAFVPGIRDLVDGNREYGIVATTVKMAMGREAIGALKAYKAADKLGDEQTKAQALARFRANYKYIGYGYLEKKTDIVPNVPLVFYSFHLMVALGGFFILLFALLLVCLKRGILPKTTWLLRVALWSIPLGYVASQLGWVVSEVGRQPWTIQDILPTMKSTSHIDVGSVQVTFFMFLALFTILLAADIGILVSQIRKGPGEGAPHV